MSANLDQLNSELINKAPVAIIADTNKKTTVFNAGAADLLGYSQGEVLGLNPKIFYYLEQTPAHLKKELQKKGTVVEDILVKHKNSTPIPVRVTLSKLSSGSVGFLEDLRITNPLFDFKADLSMTGQDDLTGALDVVADSILRRSHPEPSGVSVVLFNAEDIMAWGKAGSLNWPSYKEMFRSNGLTRKATKKGQPFTIEDLSKSELNLNPWLKDREIVSALCLPVTLDHKIAGAAWFYFQAPRAFSHDIVHALHLYANLAVHASERAYREKKQQDVTLFLQELAGSFVPLAVLENTAKKASKLFGTKVFLGGLYNIFLHRFRHEFVRTAHMTDERRDSLMGEIQARVRQIDPVKERELEENPAAFIELDHEEGKIIIVSADFPKVGVLFLAQPKATNEYQANPAVLSALSQALTRSMREKKALQTQTVIKEMTDIEIKWNLDELQRLVTRKVQEMLDCDTVGLIAFDEKTNQLLSPVFVGVGRTRREAITLEDSALIERMLTSKKPFYCENIQEGMEQEAQLLRDSTFVDREGIESTAGTPLVYRGTCVGVLFINHREPHRFTEWEKTNFLIVARYLAMVVRNILLFTDNSDQMENLEALRRDSDKQLETLETLTRTANTEISTLEFERVMEELARNATQLAPEGWLFVATWSVEQDSNGDIWGKNIGLESNCILGSYPDNIQISPEGPSGLFGKCLQEQSMQVENRVKSLEHYICHFPETNAELMVPIFVDQKVVVIIDVQHPEMDVFERYHELAFQNLAARASLALKGSRLYEELRKTKGYAGETTTLDFFALMMNTWGHDIKRELAIARNTFRLLEVTVGNEEEEAKELFAQLKERFDKLRELSTVRVPIPEPETINAETADDSPVAINLAIRKFQEDHWRRRGYSGIEIVWSLKASEDSGIRITEGWLVRLLEIIVDNAVRSLEESCNKHLEIQTRCNDSKVQIHIINEGPALPKSLMNKMFGGKITKKDGAHGSGIGLVLANAIVRTYDGHISVNKERAKGVEFIIEFPLIRIQDRKLARSI